MLLLPGKNKFYSLKLNSKASVLYILLDQGLCYYDHVTLLASVANYNNFWRSANINFLPFEMKALRKSLPERSK